MKTQIAVLIPTYNSSKTIVECLSSVFSQPGENVDITISDNASSDSTINDIHKFLDSDAASSCHGNQNLNIHEHEKNLGAYGNLSYLIGQHRDRFCYILCSDDYFISSDSLSLVKEELNKVGAEHSIITFVDNTTRLSERNRILTENRSQSLYGRKGLALFFLNGCIVGGLSNVCVNTSKLSPSVNFDPRYKYYGDVRFYIDTLVAGGKLWMSDKKICFRRHHSESISSTGNYANSGFGEALDVTSDLVGCLDNNQRALRACLGFYQHAVLLYVYYWRAAKELITGKVACLQAIHKDPRSNVVHLAFWCVVSIFMRRPIRRLLRIVYTKLLIEE